VLVGRRVQHVDVSAFQVLHSADPPVDALVGEELTGIGRRGKYLLVQADGLVLVAHLALAGWVRVRAPAPTSPVRPGRGPLALRLTARDTEGSTIALDLTEQGTKKSLAVWVTREVGSIERVARLGPEADALDEQHLADILSGTSSRVKTVLVDQTLIAGVGNAWSDEILHRARLSPFASANGLDAAQVHALYTALQDVLAEAHDAFEGVRPDRLKAAKKALLRVHARTGEPCPVCGSTIAQVSYTERSLQYCPTCQTGGRRLSDRRLDRLLK
jgi:formamidopyrimidine-DNA glycosylase